MDGKFLIPGTIKQGYLTKAPPLDKNTWTTVFKVSALVCVEFCLSDLTASNRLSLKMHAKSMALVKVSDVRLPPKLRES